MLSGEEPSWRVLKEALPALEGLKAKSSILFPSCPATVGEQWPVLTFHRPRQPSYQHHSNTGEMRH